MDNMKLWNEVKVTDPSAVKKITGKSYQGNSPKPYWLIQRATEVFGPIGKGWGVDVKSERFERLSDTDVLHVAVVSVWYVIDGVKTSTFDQMGGTKACYMTGAGKLMVDEDAGKKSVTDGMVKCLSMIGFAGDIFSGQWDDSKYVEWAAEETARRSAPEPPKLSADQVANIEALITEVAADKVALIKWIAGKVTSEIKVLSDAPAEAYEHIVKQLEKKRKQEKATA